MPENVSSAVTTWKNQPSRPDPMVSLYKVSVSDATTVYLVAGDPDGTGSLTYDGDTYTAAAIVQETYDQNIEGDLPSLRVSISNIDGLVGGYIELNDMHGREVTITHVLLTADGLDTANALSETYTIEDQAYDRQAATFVLSHANFFNKRIPTKQFQRYKCRWPYEQRFILGNGCGYPSDQFEDDSRQNLKIGGKNVEQQRKFGWYTVNAQTATNFSVDTHRFGRVWIVCDLQTADWQAGGGRNGHAMYKKLSGDFDVYTEMEFVDIRTGMFAGILCQDQATLGTWMIAGRREDANEPDIIYEVSVSLAEVAQPTTTDTTYSRLVRLQRVGDEFTAYRSDSADGPWTQIFQQTRAEFTTNVNLGLVLAVSPADIGRASVAFDYFRATVGGLAACDRTFDGVNGCSAHGNTHRFFGFRGIPHR